MRQLVSLSIFVFLMAGCSVICPHQKQVLLQDQVEFVQAFDHFQSTKNVGELQLFKETYPDSLWADRAATIIRYSQQLEQKKQQIQQLNHRQKEQLRKLHVSEKTLSGDIERLKEENRQLVEKLEQIKRLLIQLEAQPQ